MASSSSAVSRNAQAVILTLLGRLSNRLLHFFVAPDLSQPLIKLYCKSPSPSSAYVSVMVYVILARASAVNVACRGCC